MNPEDMLKLVRTEMPFGKHQGSVIADLFALYLGLQRTGVAGLDLLGPGGDAQAGSALGHALAGGLVFAALLALPRLRRN